MYDFGGVTVQVRRRIEALLEKTDAFFVFVFAGAVALRPGDEDDFLRSAASSATDGPESRSR